MTAQEQSTLRTVILHPQDTDAYALPEYKLLDNLGHDVETTTSADHVVEMLQNERADLLIIDSDQMAQKQFVQHLSDLPISAQPRQIAIFTDSVDDSLSRIVDRLERKNVQVLVKPLQMHGLLRILRNIEGKA